ncbi:hypothetical protein Tco_0268765 [Tanacetum coccineum]
MSDSEHSTITYLTELEYSDMGSPGVDGPPSPDYIPGPEAPPSPDYVPGPEAPPSPDYVPGPEAPPSPDYVPGPEAPPSPIYIPYVPEPEYPEFMPPENHVFPAEEQPLPAVVSPTADSPGYIPESDPEEEDEEDPEEDPAYYPADIGDDDEEDEEEEHLAFVDSTVVALPARPRLASPTPIYEVGETSAAGAARHDVPAIPREDPYVVAREDLYKFVDMETTIMHGLMEDARDDRSELRGRVNLLYRDRPIHHHLAVMVEREAWMARKAWGFSMDVSDDARSSGTACIDFWITGSRPPETSSVDYGTKAAKGATDTDSCYDHLYINQSCIIFQVIYEKDGLCFI